MCLETSSISVQHGLVACFDILGYKSLIEQNDVEYLYISILEQLPRIKELTKIRIQELLDRVPPSERVMDPISVCDRIEYILFADTLILTLEDQGKSGITDAFQWLTFIVACISIEDRYFRYGLPLRGGIGYGKYIVKDKLYAGKCILDSYTLSEKMEIALCAFTSEAEERIALLMRSNKYCFDGFVHRYEVPLKKNKRSIMKVITTYKCDDNIETDVYKSFRGHHKEINESGERKAQHTIVHQKYIRDKGIMNL